MPTKVQFYTQMADFTATQITGSFQTWTAFLTTAARLYKYPYHEQLMIFAQRPEATACASYDLWNDTMGRYVRRGTKGIALVDTNGDRPRLRYVFDVADTGGRENSRRPYLWEYKPEHEDIVSDALARRYEVFGNGDLAAQLEAVAALLVNEYWDEHEGDILASIEDSFLEDYDDFNVGVAFRNAATISTAYALISRCGLSPEDYFDHEDFLSVFDFNTPATVAALGTAVSQSSQEVLRQIGAAIRHYEYERSMESERAELHENRGLSDSQPGTDRTGAEVPRQVREDAEEIPEGASPDPVEQDDPERDPVSPSMGDRGNSEQTLGAADAGAGESSGRDGGIEVAGSDAVDGTDEQLQGASGGDHSDGAYFQLTLNLFASEQEQIEHIEEAAQGTSNEQAPKEDVQEAVLEAQKPTIRELFEQYKPMISVAVLQDVAYRNACRNSDRENAYIEGNAAVRRAVLASDDLQLIKLYSDMTEFHNRLHREVVDETYPQLMPPQRTITQSDIDDALRSWNGDIVSKRAVVRYMKDHAREKGTAAWLSHEYGGDPSLPLRITLAGSDQEVVLPWSKVQRRIAQLIQADDFYTDVERDNLDDVDPIAIREALAQRGIVNGRLVDPEALERDPFIQQVVADVNRIAAEEQRTASEPTVDEDAPAQFTTSKGVSYRIGDFCDVETESGPVRVQIANVNDGYVYYTFPDMPEQAPVEMFQDRFEGYLDDGSAVIVNAATQEQHEIPLESSANDTAERVEVGPEAELPYHLGDTVYLDDTAFEITEIRDNEVQLRDPTLYYPIFRAESKERFEQLLRLDSRNGAITKFLTASLDLTDADLQDALVGDGGLLSMRDKQNISDLFREGVTNRDLAHRLSETFAGTTGTMEFQSGETADFFASTVGFEINVLDKFNTKLSFSWDEIAPVLRAMYEQERDGFTREPVFRESAAIEGIPSYKVGDEVVFNNHGMDVKGTIGYIGDQEVRVDTGPYAWSNEVINRETFEQYLRQDGRNVHLFTPERNDAEQSIDITAEESAPALTGAEAPDYKVGVRVFVDNKPYEITRIDNWNVEIMDRSLTNHPRRLESTENFERLLRLDERNAHLFAPEEKTADQPRYTTETVAVYPGEKNHLPYDVVIETLHVDEPEHTPPTQPPVENFHITDDHLGEGGAKTKFRRNMDAINLLKELEFEGRQATPKEQEILSQYVGWGGLADAFDESKPNWANEFQELYTTLSPEEYEAARSSTLNAHYTSPTVIKAIYEAVGNMGFQTGNILEPAMGVGNFFGLLPEEMQKSRLYGVELDSITGRIAKQLYPNADITVAGFETTNRRDFFDLAVGNVPFGQYQVNDRAYNKLGFSIHDYFFAKSLDQVRPGGVVAFVTSRYTMDKQSPEVRKYLAQRAELLGAIRLPNNAFRANAGTDVVSDIIFLQKRDSPIDIEPDWVHLDKNEDGFAINSYFTEHPEMILGRQTSESTQYGRQDFTVVPIEGADLAEQLHEAIQHIHGSYQEAELPELGEGEEISNTIPADPDVKNYSFTVVDGEVYYWENSVMVKPDLNATATERVKGLVGLRNCVSELINLQMNEYAPETMIRDKQAELNQLYDTFAQKYGLINDRSNRLAFSSDSSYYLLCSLEVLDENGKLERKADMFSKRTIKQHRNVESVDTAVEALAISIGERSCVDLGFMASLMGGSDKIPQIVEDLKGVIYKDPATGPFDLESGGTHWHQGWQTADAYLSGNVRQKLRQAQRAAEQYPEFQINVEALEKAQPVDLEASEIEVRLGATWIDKKYIQQFMEETFNPPYYLRDRIQVNYSPYTAEWQITGKTAVGSNNVAANTTYGTDHANTYRLLEDALNLRDIRIYDTIEDVDGKEKRVLNAKETTLAAQKQQVIRDAFKVWIWKDPERRQTLVQQYNEEMNSTRPREYDGSHIVFSGMNPEITLRDHQRSAIAHVLYGGNTLLAHEVGAGKTFEMVAAAMESKRLGLCNKSMFVVPNHLTEQWASEFLRLYPSANILVTTKRTLRPITTKSSAPALRLGIMMPLLSAIANLRKSPSARSGKYGCCVSRSRTSPRVSNPSSAQQTITFLSSSWRKRKNLCKHGWRSYRPMTARTML